MVLAISACPLTITQILELVEKVEKDEMKIDDLVDGLMDSSGEDVVMEATAARGGGRRSGSR
jgi:RNA polymerase primary sigma factor